MIRFQSFRWRRASGRARSVLAVDALAPLVALLRLDRKRGDRARFEPLQGDRLAGFLAIAVGALTEALQRGIDLGDQLALTIAGAASKALNIVARNKACGLVSNRLILYLPCIFCASRAWFFRQSGFAGAGAVCIDSVIQFRSATPVWVTAHSYNSYILLSTNGFREGWCRARYDWRSGIGVRGIRRSWRARKRAIAARWQVQPLHQRTSYTRGSRIYSKDIPPCAVGAGAVPACALPRFIAI